MIDFGRTPWVDRAMNIEWAKVQKEVPLSWMPTAEAVNKQGFVLEEYGCGYYGCVMPTGEDGLVLKITTDFSEASFAQTAIDLGEWPLGIVRYHAVLQLPDVLAYRQEDDSTVRIRKTPTPPRGLRNRVYLLWREEAFAPGFAAGLVRPAYEGRRASGEVPPWEGVPEHVQNEARALIANLNEFKKQAQEVWQITSAIADPKERRRAPMALPTDLHAFLAAVWRGYISDAFANIARGFVSYIEVGRGGHPEVNVLMQRALPPPDALRAHGLGDFTPLEAYVILRLEMCRMITEIMENTPMNDTVGGALRFYLDQGIVMADVHAGNVGAVRRDGQEYPAITDPGQAVLFNPDLAKPEIRLLPG